MVSLVLQHFIDLAHNPTAPPQQLAQQRHSGTHRRHHNSACGSALSIYRKKESDGWLCLLGTTAWDLEAETCVITTIGASERFQKRFKSVNQLGRKRLGRKYAQVCYQLVPARTPFAPASQQRIKRLKPTNTRLKHQSEQFWVAEKLLFKFRICWL